MLLQTSSIGASAFMELVEYAANALDGFHFGSARRGLANGDESLGFAADVMIAAVSAIAAVVGYRLFKRRNHFGFIVTSSTCAVAVFCFLWSAGNATAFWYPADRLVLFAKTGVALSACILIVAVLSRMPRWTNARSAEAMEQEISQRRRTELELRKVHTKLESVIELRTAELAGKNEELGHFLNAVTHDLKSPVATCLGLTKLLREDIRAGQVEEVTETVDRIDRSIGRMRRMIDDLLHLGRIGQIPFEPSHVDTEKLFQSLVEEFTPRLNAIGARLSMESTAGTAHADPHWLRVVLENLINNAMKYGCDNPQPVVTLGVSNSAGECKLFVRDNGGGIDPAHHAGILQPFRRLRTDKEGSGMGLAIVARIVKMHGGRIWIESRLGQGACFNIALPHVLPTLASHN